MVESAFKNFLGEAALQRQAAERQANGIAGLEKSLQQVHTDLVKGIAGLQKSLQQGSDLVNAITGLRNSLQRGSKKGAQKKVVRKRGP